METKSRASLFASLLPRRNSNSSRPPFPSLPQTLLLSSSLRARVRLTTGERAALTSSREQEREGERKRGRKRRKKGAEGGRGEMLCTEVRASTEAWPVLTQRVVPYTAVLVRWHWIVCCCTWWPWIFVPENDGPFPQTGFRGMGAGRITFRVGCKRGCSGKTGFSQFIIIFLLTSRLFIEF